MRAEITRLTAHGMCEALTLNELLVVFRPPASPLLRPGETLEFSNLATEGEVRVTHPTSGDTFAVTIQRNDIHDLRLPGGHGTSRIPSEARLRGA